MNKNLFKILFWMDSRKVCFGVTLFYVSTALLWLGKINMNIWVVCVILATALVGGGTVVDALGDKLLDRVFGKRADAPQPPAA
jgi:hypothetical protein